MGVKSTSVFDNVVSFYFNLFEDEIFDRKKDMDKMSMFMLLLLNNIKLIPPSKYPILAQDY